MYNERYVLVYNHDTRQAVSMEPVTVVTYHLQGIAFWSGEHGRYIVGTPQEIVLPEPESGSFTSPFGKYAWSAQLFESFVSMGVSMGIYLDSPKIVGEAEFVQWTFAVKGGI